MRQAQGNVSKELGQGASSLHCGVIHPSPLNPALFSIRCAACPSFSSFLTTPRLGVSLPLFLVLIGSSDKTSAVMAEE